MTITFHELKVGDRGRVVGFADGDIGHRQKLLSMGLTPGAEFSVTRVAPLGDPVEIRVRGVDISLRRDEVSDLQVEPLDPETIADTSKTLTIAIVGNPNCGKSTLFNGLTGANQRVGNWPGVTVEKKVGAFFYADQKFRVVDLPGVYSLDSFDENVAIDERIARDYVLSGEADLIVDVVDASNLERNLYLTTQLLEMRVPVVVVLNVMEEDAARGAKYDVTALERALGCPVTALVAARRKEVEAFKDDLQLFARSRPRPVFALVYPPLLEEAAAELTRIIEEASPGGRFDSHWLAVRLLEGDSFATRHVAPAAKEAHACWLADRKPTDSAADVTIADSRYRFIHELAERAGPRRSGAGRGASALIDKVALNRFLGIPIFLFVMYCLFWFTIQLSRAFKPFFNQVSDILFVDGARRLLTDIQAPGWLVAVLAEGLGNGLLQVVNFIPIIGFLYIFVGMLEESGYMARANFVMDRLMKALGLPGNAFVPMVVGFGCNVPSIMATRTLERPRDRVVAVLMAPFMSCGGRLAVYTVFAAAFFPQSGQLVVFAMYLLGIVFAMITAFFMKSSLLPQERSLFALELPSYHWPKLRNVLIGAYVRVKMFVMRVGKFIIPLVFILKILSAWGTDGSFEKRPIDQSMLAAGGKAITPVLAPMGVSGEQWPATVALLTGVLHKVVIVSTLESIYLEARPHAPPGQDFDLWGRLQRAALTIPTNLKALISGQPLSPGHRPLVDFDRTTKDRPATTKAQPLLAPALASRFDGALGAIAFLILALCYPCIATSAATTRETNRRWTGFMVLWTLSLGYGLAVLFYQVGTFARHPLSSGAWIAAVLAYFALLGVFALRLSPLGADARPRPRETARAGEASVPPRAVSRGGVAGSIAAALLIMTAAGLFVAGRTAPPRSVAEKPVEAPPAEAPPAATARPEEPKAPSSQESAASGEPPPALAAPPTEATPVPAPKTEAAEEPPPAESQAPPAPPVEPSAAPRTYKVAPGDTLKSIAVKLFGDENRWRDIVRANPRLDARRLRAGQTLALPSVPRP
jgi:ferrous iron transport protein B